MQTNITSVEKKNEKLGHVNKTGNVWYVVFFMEK